MASELGSRVRVLEKKVARLEKELAEQPRKIGEMMLAAAERKAALADEPSCSYAESLHAAAQVKSEEVMKQIKSSVQAIKLTDLSSVSQDVAIGIIVATALLHDKKGQEKLTR